MDKKKSAASGSSSFDHLFGPRVTSSPSSSTTGSFQSIFPLPLTGTTQAGLANRDGAAKYQPPNSGFPSERGERRKNKERKSYQNEETQIPCNLSSSIYYGGRENYSSSISSQSTTNQDVYKKDGEEGDSESASRGNWWEGSLYY